MKKLIGGLVIVLLVAGGFVGAMYWSGAQAERWYQQALADSAKSPNVKLTTERYERGLFSSHSLTRVQLVMPEGDLPKEMDPSFSIRQDIYHGPLPLAGQGVADVPMHWGGAVIRATLEPESSAWTRALKKWYGDREPVVAISKVGFDGTSDTQITMPPLTLSEVEALQSFNFSGLKGQIRVAPRGSAVQGDMTVASLEVVGKPTADQGASAPAPRLNLRDLTAAVNQRKGAFDLMLGDSNFKIGELRAQDPSAPVILTNLGMDATAALSPNNPQQVDVDVRFKTEKFTVDSWSGSGGVGLSFRQLDGATIGRLQEWQQNLAVKPDNPQALDELLKLVKELLRGRPEFVFDSQAKLAQGDWRGKLTLNFQDYGALDPAQDLGGLLHAVAKGLAEIKVSKSLAETVLTQLAQSQLQAESGDTEALAGQQAMRTLAAQQVARQLEGMTAAGFLRLEGNDYRTVARFESGKLFVNDQEIPLGATAGMGQ